MDTLIKDISHESLNYIPSDPQALFTGFGWEHINLCMFLAVFLVNDANSRLAFKGTAFPFPSHWQDS